MPSYLNVRKSSAFIGLLACLIALAIFLTPSYAAQEGTGQLHSQGAFSSLVDKLGLQYKTAEPLPPEKAFAVQARLEGSDTVVVRLSPVEGYYLYRDRFSVDIVSPDTVKVQRIDLPPGESKDDPTFGTVVVYRSPFEAKINLSRPAKGTVLELRLNYQGCSDLGICYPPVQLPYSVKLPDRGAQTLIDHGQPVAGANSIHLSQGEPSKRLSSGQKASAQFRVESGILLLAGFYGVGLLLSLTPCVWPLVPILSGIIAGQGETISRQRSLLLSACYVLGMAIAYTAFGVIAGLSGALVSTILQNIWVAGATAMLFVFLAMAMFGLVTLNLPNFLQAPVAGQVEAKGKGLAGAFGMGVVSAAIVGPCIVAPLAAALLYIGQTGDVLLGGAALFALALGKGTPLILLGTSIGSFMPRAGPWMAGIKVLLGSIMLLVAILTVAPYVPPTITMALIGVLLIGFALGHVGTLNEIRSELRLATVARQSMAIVALVVGVIYMIGAVSGAKSLLAPLAQIGKPTEVKRPGIPVFERISTSAELDAKIAASGGRTVVVDVYADWCISCKAMELLTFSDPAVQTQLSHAVLLRLDVTEQTVAQKELMRRHNLFGPPAVLFFNNDGAEKRAYRVVGYMQSEYFSRVLNGALSSSKGENKHE